MGGTPRDQGLAKRYTRNQANAGLVKERGLRMKVPRTLVLLSALSLPMVLIASSGSVAAASGAGDGHPAASAVTSSSLGTFSPTFAGPAATGCAAAGCSLLSGPFSAPSTAAAAQGHPVGGQGSVTPRALPAPNLLRRLSAADQRRLRQASTFPVPSVSCAPLATGCDRISTAAGGATAVKGLNAVDSARHTTNNFKRHRAAGPGPVRRQRVRDRDQQHRRDPGLQHRLEAEVRADLARHGHGTRQAALEQRRGYLLHLRLRQRRALVLHPVRLGQPGVQGRPVRRLLRGPWPTAATRASR